MMEILIRLDKPIFRCLTDEEVFFQRIDELKGLTQCTQKAETFYLSFLSVDHHAVIQAIQSISDMWNTQFTIQISP